MRPREHYLLTGPEALGELELLTLALGNGVSGRPARAIAADLLDQFGSAPGVAHAPPRALARVKGMGEARAVHLHAALSLGLRRDPPAEEAEPVRDASDAARWLQPRLTGLPHEEIHALFLDRRLRPLAVRRLSAGTEAYAVLEPGQVLRPAIQLGAHAVVLAHNHPSGDPAPSPEDVHLTERLRRGCELVGLRLVDHLVFGGAGWRSILADALSPSRCPTSAACRAGCCAESPAGAPPGCGSARTCPAPPPPRRARRRR